MQRRGELFYEVAERQQIARAFERVQHSNVYFLGVQVFKLATQFYSYACVWYLRHFPAKVTKNFRRFLCPQGVKCGKRADSTRRVLRFSQGFDLIAPRQAHDADIGWSRF